MIMTRIQRSGYSYWIGRAKMIFTAIGADFVTNYFYALDDPEYKEFIECIPNTIRPDRG